MKHNVLSSNSDMRSDTKLDVSHLQTTLKTFHSVPRVAQSTIWVAATQHHSFSVNEIEIHMKLVVVLFIES